MTPRAFPNRKRALARALLHWYRKNGRDLPWRRTRNAYRILLSEVMLQQTQVSRVVEKYPRFLRQFPTLASLARARRRDVILAWRGMGYNNRAVHLHLLAREVMQRHSGFLPHTLEALQRLPGIGKYTAHAVGCFAFGLQVPAVDTNVRRVMTRLFPRELRRLGPWTLAQSLLPHGRANEWNQAMFDLGATLCTAKRPLCAACPLRRQCPSAFLAIVRRIAPPKREPGRDGVPNRIYRGRVVETLRNLQNRDSIASQRLGRFVKPDFRKEDEQWFLQLLQSLQRDGVIRVRPRGTTVHVSLEE